MVFIYVASIYLQRSRLDTEWPKAKAGIESSRVALLNRDGKKDRNESRKRARLFDHKSNNSLSDSVSPRFRQYKNTLDPAQVLPLYTLFTAEAAYADKVGVRKCSDRELIRTTDAQMLCKLGYSRPQVLGDGFTERVGFEFERF